MEDLLISVNWLAVLTATLLYFIFGALWYSPVLFANVWMKLRNLNEEDIGDPNPLIFLYSFLLQFLAVLSLAIFFAAMNIHTPMHGIIAGFGTGAGILFTTTGTTGLFSDTPLKLHFIDNGYHVLGLTLSGLILGLWS